MAGYTINKNHHNDSVVSLQELDGYKFKPKQKNDNYVSVNEVTIINKEMIDKILSLKFEKSFKKLVNMAMYVLNDEDETDETAASVVLDEVELVRQVLLNRYQKFLNHEKEELFLKKLRVIENEMRLKQIQIKQKAIYLEQEEAKTQGRGR